MARHHPIWMKRPLNDLWLDLLLLRSAMKSSSCIVQGPDGSGSLAPRGPVDDRRDDRCATSRPSRADPPRSYGGWVGARPEDEVAFLQVPCLRSAGDHDRWRNVGGAGGVARGAVDPHHQGDRSAG